MTGDHSLFISEGARRDLFFDMSPYLLPHPSLPGWANAAMFAGQVGAAVARFRLRWQHDPVLRATWMML